MRTLLRSSLAVALLAPALAAQTRTVAERLGYPKDAKLLILHADDLGAAHSIDAATFDALDKGVISSASIMMPTPWVTEVAAYAKVHPNHDLGLHLTLLMGRSALSPGEIPGLVNDRGGFADDPVTAGCRYFFQRGLREQLRREIPKS